MTDDALPIVEMTPELAARTVVAEAAAHDIMARLADMEGPDAIAVLASVIGHYLVDAPIAYRGQIATTYLTEIAIVVSESMEVRH